MSEQLHYALFTGCTAKQSTPELLSSTLAVAKKLGLTMITICNTCQLNSAMTKHALDKDPELKARVNEKLAEVGLEYKGTSEIKHFLYAIIDALEGKPVDYDHKNKCCGFHVEFQANPKTLLFCFIKNI
jgi:succinate dehydrogenase / fumarate reductase cytochrome b subunit